MLLLLLLLLLELATAVVALAVDAMAESKGHIVQTTHGPVQGSLDDKTGFATYHGVRFAASPTGDLRWRAPRDPEAWTEPMAAVRRGHVCPQLDLLRGVLLGKEDCFSLSVYVPSGCTPDSQCAVMQWIFGGAWIMGDNYEFGVYDATRLASLHGVVVVAANYRVDLLGWLALDELQAEGDAEGGDGGYGNYGLRDQQHALRWTQANVAAFGGDPNRVTLFGESAGGFSVCQHLVAPASDRLFSRAIVQSAGCDGPFLLVDGENARRFGGAYADHLGCHAGDRRLACLRAVPPSKALTPYVDWLCLFRKKGDPWCVRQARGQGGAAAAHNTSGAWPAAGDVHTGWPSILPPLAPLGGWIPVVDGVVLPDTPLRLIERGAINRGPRGEALSVVIGSNHDEMALFLVLLPTIIPGIHLPVSAHGIPTMAQHMAAYNAAWNEGTAASIVDFYTHRVHAKTEAYRVVQLVTELIFRCPARDAASALARHGVRSYLYHYNHHASFYVDPTSLACELTSEALCGVFHASELPFVFDHPLLASDDDRRVASAIGFLWTNLAKFGTPNAPTLARDATRAADADVPHWPRYNDTADAHLEIGAELSAGSGLAKESCDFWAALPKQTAYRH